MSADPRICVTATASVYAFSECFDSSADVAYSGLFISRLVFSIGAFFAQDETPYIGSQRRRVNIVTALYREGNINDFMVSF